MDQDERHYTIIDHQLKCELDLTGDEYIVLMQVRILSRREWCSKSKRIIGEELGFSKNGITILIDRLTKRGFIRKGSGKNSRLMETTEKWNLPIEILIKNHKAIKESHTEELPEELPEEPLEELPVAVPDPDPIIEEENFEVLAPIKEQTKHTPKGITMNGTKLTQKQFRMIEHDDFKKLVMAENLKIKAAHQLSQRELPVFVEYWMERRNEFRNRYFNFAFHIQKSYTESYEKNRPQKFTEVKEMLDQVLAAPEKYKVDAETRFKGVGAGQMLLYFNKPVNRWLITNMAPTNWNPKPPADFIKWVEEYYPKNIFETNMKGGK